MNGVRPGGLGAPVATNACVAIWQADIVVVRRYVREHGAQKICIPFQKHETDGAHGSLQRLSTLLRDFAAVQESRLGCKVRIP